VDTIIVIPNDRLLTVSERRSKLIDAFRMADDVLRQGVQGVSDIILIPGLINVDFADVKAIMTNSGTAIMGIGIASGDNRAGQAATAAIESPLLETTIQGARGVLLNITAGSDFTLDELFEASTVVQRATDEEDAFIITGCVIDDVLGDEVRVTVLATGFPGQTPGSSHIYGPETGHAGGRGGPAAPRSLSSGGGPVRPSNPPHPGLSHPSQSHPGMAPHPQAPQQPPQQQPSQQTSTDWDVPPFLRNKR
jgi:cell division GTPase FtsZ